MPPDPELERRLREAEALVRQLQAENEDLAERQVDTSLLGLVNEQLLLEDDPEVILQRGLERISVLKDLPCCAVGDLEGDALVLRQVFLARSVEPAWLAPLRLSPRAAGALRAGAVALDEAGCAELGLTAGGLGGFAPRAAALVPFTCRTSPRGVFLFADDDPGRSLVLTLPVLARVAEGIGSRLENVALLRELQALNADLDQKVAARTVALSDALAVLEREMAERHRAEAALLQAQKLEAVGRLAGGVAHDFNNLLTTIIGMGELVLDGLPPDGAATEDVRAILSAAHHAASLTRQLLTFSRNQRLEEAPVRLDEVCRAFSPMLTRLLGEGIDVRLELAPGVPPTLGDRSQLEQVLMNLALNARDAMPRGGTLRIEVAGEAVTEAGAEPPPGRWVRLTVADTGTGMAPEVAARVFEPFFTTKERGRGTGLGLATVYGVVRQHGGHVRLRTAPGQGTRFDVFLPAGGQEQAGAPAGGQGGAPAGRGELVLVVDDDASVRRTASAMLRRLGYRVLEARGGEEALAAAAAAGGAVDALLTDVAMPGLRGPELAAAFRRAWPGRAVLLMSGYVEDGLHPPLAADAFLPKPLSSDALARALRAALDGSAAPGPAPDPRPGG